MCVAVITAATFLLEGVCLKSIRPAFHFKICILEGGETVLNNLLYRYGVKLLLCVRFSFAVGLFAGFERQRFGELNCNPAQEATYVINAADMA